MANTPLTTIDWTATGVMPTTGLEFWHQYEFGGSASNAVYDYSGNARHLTCASSGAPALTENALNGQPAWYFSGSSNYLNYDASADPVTLKHLFIIASHDDATFSATRGLFSDASAYSVLVGESGTTKFYDFSADFTSTYRKNDTVFAASTQTAPISGAFALIEVQIPSGISLNAIRVGQQMGDATRKWKGYFVEQAGFSRVLNYEERRRVHLLFNLRFRVNSLGVPLYFPSSDLVPQLASQPLVRERFNDVPRDFARITDSYEFEDGGRTFNEVADDVPRRWEYTYQNVPKAQKPIFDEFDALARRATTFYFKDPEGFVWTNVRTEKYGRTHDKHKRWRNTVDFDLIGYSSTASFEGWIDTYPPEEATGVDLSVDGTTITVTWDEGIDLEAGNGSILLEDGDDLLVEG